jgi:gliding motility-associated-like protein
VSTNGGGIWNDIAGETGATYNILAGSVTTSLNAYQYRAVVTALTCQATSNAATLTVNGVVISSQPANQGPCLGGSATFSVTATGPGLSYQWQENTGSGFSNVGTNNPSYNIASVTSGMNGNTYKVIISSNGLCAVTSSVVTLSVNTSTTINTQPQSGSLCVGSPMTLTVNASGSGVITYLWKKGGVTIVPNETSSSYTISSLTSGDADSYTVDVNSGCGLTTSNAAVITVNPIPVITSQPSDITRCEGVAASFTVATSASSPTYQWQVSTNSGSSWTDISGETAATYSIAAGSVTTSLSTYQYRAIVTALTCEAISNAVTLTVNPTPIITTQPSDITRCEGVAASFTVATSTASPGYQWQVSTNGGGIWNDIVGEIAATYSIAAGSVTASLNSYQYRAVVTASSCPATSNAATLTVNPTPSITSQPSDITRCEGVAASFTVATSTASPGYQWQVSTDNGNNWSDLFAEIAATYNIAAGSVASSLNAYQYRAVVTALTCEATSNAGTLTVNPTPVITSQPSDITRCEGAAASFTVATSTVSPGYQWQVSTDNGNNWSDISGEITDTYTIVAGSVNSSLNNNQYRAVVTALSCEAISDAATLLVNPIPSITTQPSDITRCEGVAASFTVGTSIASPGYQWQVSTDNGNNWSDLFAENAATYDIAAGSVTSPLNAYQYRAVVTALSCEAISDTAILTVNPTPIISIQPSDITRCEGVAASFTVATSASSPGYQWQVSTDNGNNWSDISGETMDTYTIVAGSVNSSLNNNQYRVVVTALTCQSTSTAALITVNPPPLAPTVSNVTYCQNATASALTATGTGTLNWYTASSGGAPLGAAPTPSTATVGNPAVSYYVSQTVNSCEGPVAQVDVIINDSPAITNNPLTDQICEGSTWTGLTLSSSLGVTTTYSWTSSASAGISGNTASGTGNLPTDTYSNSGSANGTVTYTIVPTANSCPGSSANFIVTVKPKPVVSNSPLTASVCEGTLWAGLTITSDVADSSFTWTSSASSGVSGNTASGTGDISSSTFINTNTINGTVTYTITPTANSCTGAPSDYIVTVKPFYQFTDMIAASDDTICEFSTATFTINNSSADSYNNWILPAGATVTSNNASGSLITVLFGNTGGAISVSPVQGCTPGIPDLSSSIVVMSKPVANAGADITLTNYGAITLNGSQSTASTGYSYLWTADNSANIISNPTSIITAATVNTISANFILTVQANGVDSACFASDDLQVGIEANLIIPNVFSPNDDGNHDVFEIQGIEFFPEAILNIYNQWGELVFKSGKGYPEKWDGKRHGKTLPVGTYYYVLSLKSEKAEDKSGVVSILK